MSPIAHTLIAGFLSFVALVVIIRLSGKRTLSKWNAFDFVITIALGSTLSTALITPTVSLAQSVVAFVLIVALQFVITFTSVRSKRVEDLVKSRPTLLLYDGTLRHAAMARERVVAVEILAALRERGIADIESVHAVVLETDGTFSVIPDAGSSDSALAGVEGVPSC